MSDELNKEKEAAGSSAPAAERGPKLSDEEVKKAQLQKEVAELEAAKAAANAELQRVRAEKRKEKKEKPDPAPAPEEEEKELVIDESDPNSKAWLNHIDKRISPVAQELEKEKQEIRSFAISKFLESKPSLAKNPDKLKELMQVYERSHVASERTVEGVLVDLEKAYAYTHSAELLEAARLARIEDARKNAIFSDIAVSRGATGYAAPETPKVKLSDEDKSILQKWGMTESEWSKMKKEQEEKASKA